MTHDDVIEQLIACRLRSSDGCDGCVFYRPDKTACLDSLLENAAKSICQLRDKNIALTDLVKESQKTAQECLDTARGSQEIAKRAVALLERAVK